MTTLAQWFEKGMSSQDYIDAMRTNKDELQTVYDRFHIREEDEERLEDLAEKNFQVIVLTEDWCGDAMLNVPILLKICEQTKYEVRMLLRDDNLELMDQYLTNGTARAIPIFIFIDAEGNEQAVWGPRAPQIQQLVDEKRAKLPPKEDAQFEEMQKQTYGELNDMFVNNEQLSEFVYQDIIATLERVK